MKAAARSAALLLLAASVSACGAQSQFTRRNARASEIVWRVNGALQATKGGRVVAEGRSFSGLDEAVSCVPMARERASAAHSSYVGGQIATWSGFTVMIGGAGAGVGMMFADREKLLWPGAAVAIGSAVLGGIVAIVGANLIAKSRPAALDAVNMYNDHYAATRACRGFGEKRPLGPRVGKASLRMRSSLVERRAR